MIPEFFVISAFPFQYLQYFLFSNYQILVCEEGYFGNGCKGVCVCRNNATCNPISGACSCKPGWRGQHCDRPCPDGRYGEGCKKVCNCSSFG